MRIGPQLSVHMILHRAVEYDYPFLESLRSALPLAGEYHLVVHDSTDGTWEAASDFQAEAGVRVSIHRANWWSNERGCECLADATNLAIEHCRGRYHLALQADEVLHEDDLPALERLMRENVHWAELGRLNLHGSGGFDRYNANRDRWPCSVVRLARREYYPTLRSYGDATHLGWCENWDPLKHPRIDATSDIALYHYSYVRPGRAFVDRQASMAMAYGRTPDPDIEKHRHGQRIEWKGLIPDEEFAPLPKPHPAVMREWIERRRGAVERGDWEL